MTDREAMTPRERVLRAIRFEPPDRIPVIFHFAEDNLVRHGQALLDLCGRYPCNDLSGPPEAIPDVDPGVTAPGAHHHVYADAWGSVWEERLYGHEGQIVGHPLADWSAYAGYMLPPTPPTDPGHPDVRQERAAAVARKRTHYVRKLFVRTFERLHFLRGFDRVCEDLALGRPEIADLADRITDHNREWFRWAIATGADGVVHSDDWGAQTSMLISPDLWREFFKPRYARQFEPALEAGVDIWFHTDGYTLPILPDLAELGVRVLNPQFSCHDLSSLAAVTRREGLVVESDVDRQFIMPRGTPEQVRTHIREIVDIFEGLNGGLIGRTAVRGPVPLANIEAALAAWHDFGTPP